MQVLANMDQNSSVEGMDFDANHNLNFYNGCVYVKNTIVPDFIRVGVLVQKHSRACSHTPM